MTVKDLEEYKADPRLKLVHAPSQQRLPFDVQAMLLYAHDSVNAASWHWLGFHYSKLPPHPITIEIATACAQFEACIPGLGKKFVDNIASLKNKEKHEPHYEAMLQVLSEMLVIGQILDVDWPKDANYEYEPIGKSGKRPEFRVSSGGVNYLFEVKAPSLLTHIRSRQSSGVQVPGRTIPRESIERLARGEAVTLPRDNPVKDFLISAEQKFSDFERDSCINVLVIFWDDFIFEPVTSLCNERSGLLTKNSYFKSESGNPVDFPSIDTVVVVQHMSYFYKGLADQNMFDRNGIFDFGDESALPNVFFPTRHGRDVPRFIYKALRATDFRSQDLQSIADYRPQEIVFWLNR